MANYATLKAAIAAAIKTNGNKEITGQLLQDTLDSIVSVIGANYTFAGVATPSTNPGTPDQNVFYLASQAGTYTNFNATVLPAGISILKWNGSWSSQTFFTVETTPTSGSANLITSGAVFDAIKNDGGAYDVSAHFPTGGAEGGNTYTLETAITMVPSAMRKGGMSIKFVQSSDNKYVQYRLTSDSWSVDTADWAIADEGVYVENSEFVYVKTDAEGKILWAIKIDGGIYYGAGVPQQVKDYIEDKISSLSLDEYEDIVAFLNDYLGSDTTLKAMIDSINAHVAAKLDAGGLDPEALGTVQAVESPEYIQVTTDNEDKILEGIKSEGVKQINLPVETPSATIEHVDNPEWIDVKTDNKGLVIEGTNKNGEKYIGTLDYVTLKKLINLISQQIKEEVPIDLKYDNVDFSHLVVGKNNTGGSQRYCIAVGVNILTNNTGIKNHVFGMDSMANCTGDDNTAMGYHSCYRNTSGRRNSAFGSESQDDVTTGEYNSSFGFCSLQRNNTGSYNVAIGTFALRGGVEGTQFDPENLKSFNRNTVIGSFSLHTSLSGTNDNIVVGYGALTSEKVYNGCIAIGNNIDCDKDNQTVIGNSNTVETIIYGDLIVAGTDGKKRQVVFNQDGTCSWVEINN